jgi:predicted amidohydrolase
MRVAAIQLGPADEDRSVLVDRIVGLIGQARGEGVRLGVLPELALSAYFPAAPGTDPATVANEFGDELMQPVLAAVVAANMWLVLPFAERVGRQLYNTSVLVSPGGQAAATYRKAHIPGGFKTDDKALSLYERQYFTPGNLGYPVAQADELKVGMLICYDRFYPEAARVLALNGADVICYSTNSRHFGTPWVHEGWEVLIRARAYENGCYVIAPGKAGIEGGERYLGDSLIVSPYGAQVIGRAQTDGDELVVADLDGKDRDAARSRTDWARDRRGETYGDLLR